MAKSTLTRGDFHDRIGTNGHLNSRPSRITYLAHGKGWVMVRHPGCVPFAITEKEWLAFPPFNQFRPTDARSVT